MSYLTPTSNAEAFIVARAIRGNIKLNGRNGFKLGETGLKTSDFVLQNMRLIWGVGLAIEARGEKVNLVSLATELDSSIAQIPEHLRVLSWMIELEKLVEQFNDIGDCENALKTIKSASRNRSVARIAQRLAEDPTQLQWGVAELISLLSDTQGRVSSQTLAQAQKVALSVIEQYSKVQDGVTGVNTGLQCLNDATGGWQPSDLIVIGGLPAMGKTAFSLTTALSAAKHGKRVGFITSEMANTQIAMRSISGSSGVSLTKIRKGQLTQDDWGAIAGGIHAMTETGVNKLIHLSDTALDLDSVLNQARAWHREFEKEGGLSGGLIVDYLQNIKVNRKGKALDKTLEVGTVSQELKGLAKELNIPVIALSQVNKDVEKRSDRRPTASDCLWASQITQDADFMAFLYRHEIYDRDNESAKGVAELVVRKNRHGAVDTLYTKFRPERVDFIDLDEYDQSRYLESLTTRPASRASGITLGRRD